MAKRKLSLEQRSTLRRVMAEGLKAGREVGELVKEAAKKYGITTVTATWYLKSLGGGPKPAARSKRGKAKRGAAGSQGRNGVLDRLVKVVQSKTAQVAKRAREAQSLVPRWRDLVKEQHHLKGLESKVRRQLQVVGRKAKALRNRIRRLVGT